MSATEYFEKISQIPHASGNTAAISNMIAAFAKDHNLDYHQDELGNVIIYKEPSRSYENAPTVILQGHMDMVGESITGSSFDFSSDPLKLCIVEKEHEGTVKKYLTAKGTTLGGDDGVAIAYMLSILEDKDYLGPALECVFTVDEEIGMIGASHLDMSRLRGRIMINLDNGEMGSFLAGCAGGVTAKCELNVNRVSLEDKAIQEGKKYNIYKLEIGGLTGGHSGEDIIYERANSNVLLGRVLYELNNAFDIEVFSFSGGSKDNVIPSYSEAIIAITDSKEIVNNCLEDLLRLIKDEFRNTDPNMFIKLTQTEADIDILDSDSKLKAIAALFSLPNGIQKMSPDFKNLVQTSLNMGILKTTKDEIIYSFSVRSSVASEKDELVNRLTSLMRALGGSVSLYGDYPAWEYKPKSKLLELLSATYRELFFKEPYVGTIHAGLECGLFSKSLEGLDCVSIGPDLIDIHTPNEMLELESFDGCYRLLRTVIERIK